MSSFLCSLIFEDKAYGRAVAKKLSALSFADVVLDPSEISQNSIVVTDSPSVFSAYDGRSVLADGCISFAGLRSLICSAAEELGFYQPTNEEFDASACRLLMLTSAGFGEVLSLVSKLLGRYLSRIKRQRVLLLDFSPLVCTSFNDALPQSGKYCAESFLLKLYDKEACADISIAGLLDNCISEDEYGLQSLILNPGFNPLFSADPPVLRSLISKLCSGGRFDSIVLSVPAAASLSATLSRISERVIFIESGKAACSGGFYRDFVIKNCCKESFLSFDSGDSASDDADIYGETGKEVGRFAEMHRL